MNEWLIAIMSLGAVLFFISIGAWIFVALAIVGIFLLTFLVGGGMQSMIGAIQFNLTNSFTYTALPLFIYMGEIIIHSKLSDRLYQGATSWVGFLPGGLLHTNIVACSAFAALSGSSMATAATIGTIALPEMQKRGYNAKMLLGSIAAGGTLGPLIPPSTVLIIYGAFVGESIGQLFMGGLIPGLVLAGFYMLYILVATIIHPQLAPGRIKFSLREMAYSGLLLWPILILISAVLGSIYLGVATPTEAAAVGAFGATLLCIAFGRLTLQVLKDATKAAALITCWIIIIMIAAQVLTMGLSLLEVPAQVATAVVSSGLSKYWIVATVIFLYLILGCLLECVSMMMLTLPVLYPVMISLGFNGVWFGVLTAICIEMGNLTPPFGINLFVLDGLTGGKQYADVVKGTLPFLTWLIVLAGLVTAFPQLVLWLPSTMFQRY